jgi:hypothetical protein
MAIYHLHCDIIGRTAGRSAVAAAAYRATSRIEDRTTGEVFNYRRKEKALYTVVLTGANAPQWAKNRAELWNSCEEKENRKNSQFCRSFDGALPREFDLKTNIKLARKFAKIFTDRGTPADLAIHGPHKDKDGRSNENTHFHLLVATRKMNENGWAEKDREANDKNFLKEVRKAWADIVNAEFKRKGMSERIDERTLKEQGLDREAQQHLGPKATAIQREGKQSDRRRYKSEEHPQSQAVQVTDEELQNALQNDPEVLRLLDEKDKLLNSPEAKAERSFQKWSEEILAKHTSPQDARERVRIKIASVEKHNFFWYVHYNKDAEIEFWQKKKFPGNKVWNEGIDKTIQKVKEVARAPYYKGEIAVKSDRLYDESFQFSNDSNGEHKSAFRKWVSTTDFAPVKIARMVVQKLREWRDALFPHLEQSQDYHHGRGRK